jgi:cytidylate kinase
MSDSVEKLDVVAIDGPSGVGKSTVSRKIAIALDYAFLDTGAMYRAVGYFLRKSRVPFDREEKVAEALQGFSLRFLPAKKDDEDVGVVVNDENISVEIRRPEMAMIASHVSTLLVVREFLTKIQRSLGKEGRVVAEGRDVGTVVFPQAAHKFFLDAQPEVRARRRLAQLQAKGVVANVTEVLQQIVERDSNDRNRTFAPLKMAEDAILIDTTMIALEEVVSMILGVVAQRQGSGLSL